MASSARETVRQLPVRAVAEVAEARGFAAPAERAKRPEQGDFSSNVALALAKGEGRPPRVGAEAIVARLPTGGGSPLAEVGIAGLGFINLRLTKEDDG